MDSYWLFAIVWFVAAAAPGADTALLVSTTLARGWKSAIPISLGITTAKVILLLLAFFGLSALLTAAPQTFIALKVFGCAFLLWRAYRLWTREPLAASSSETQFGQNFAVAFTTAISNPQAMLFYVAIVPQVTATTDPLILSAIIAIGFTAISAGYVALALPIRGWISRGQNERMLNRGLALVFVLVAAIIALR